MTSTAIDYSALAAKLRIISDPVRVRILRLLSCREMCACDVLAQLEISQSTLSHHMKVLRQAGLIHTRKQGTWMHYTINRAAFENLQDDLTALIQPDSDCESNHISSSCTPDAG